MHLKLSDYPEIAQASVSEQLELINQIWEQVRYSDGIPVNRLHTEELQRRVKMAQDNPDALLSPGEARRLIRE